MLHLLTRWMKTGLVREGGIGCETLVTAEWGRDGCPGLSSSSSPLPLSLRVKLEPCVLQKVHTKLERCTPS